MKLKTLIATLLVSTSAQSDMLCFDQDHVKVEHRNEWTHNTVVVWPHSTLVGPDGRTFVRLDGYGWNYAKDDKGEVDIVPVSGGAVQQNNGTWIVSLMGTLRQTTIYDYVGYDPYYIISVNWKLNPITLNGEGYIGNLTKDFANANPDMGASNDDSYEILIRNIDCGLIYSK